MMTPAAKDSMRRLLQDAGTTRLRLQSDEPVSVEAVHDANGFNFQHGTSVLLTISSIAFRLLLVLHMQNDQDTQHYFSGGNPAPGGASDGFLERANLLGGAINQALVAHYPDMGMSTPYEVNARSLTYLEMLGAHDAALYRFRINNAATVIAGYWICATGEVDFVAQAGAPEESMGEMEMF